MQGHLGDESPRRPVDKQLDPVQRLVAELDTLAGEAEGDLVGTVGQADGAVVAHRALLSVTEVVGQPLGSPPQEVGVVEIALQRRLAGAAVPPLVVVLIQILLPSIVQLLQGYPLGDVGQELHPHRPVETLDLTAPNWPVCCCIAKRYLQ